MRKGLALTLIFCVASIQPLTAAPVNALIGTGSAAVEAQDSQWEQTPAFFSNEQLENLMAPIALYPDPLLAQVLVAATFPDQIDEAARIMRAYNSRYDVDTTWWDVSVKAVAHYPSVLFMMADKIDWTTSVGQAYVNQSTEVMEAVQRLRRQARTYGNLVTTPQQQIVETDGYIYIYPAQPQFIYVPVYETSVVFFPRRPLYTAPAIWFGVGLMIGAWLNHDCDWQHHRVFYHGWERGPVWVQRSRPFIRVNNTYIHRRYDNVVINRTVVDRRVNYGALNRYNAIHHDADFSNVRRGPGGPADRGERGEPIEANRDNKIIRRNIDPNDPRISANRGHEPAIERRPETGRPEARGPEINRTFPTPPIAGPARQAEVRPEIRRPERPLGQIPPPASQQPGTIQPSPRTHDNVQIPRTGPSFPQQPPIVRTNPPPSPVFRGNTGAIDSRDASRRGESSRRQESHAGPPGGAGPKGQAQRAPSTNRPNTPGTRRPR